MKKYVKGFLYQFIVSTKTKFSKNYFKSAKNWADDCYTEAITSRNRYRCALLISVVMILALLTLLIMLFPLQHTELVVVHQSDDGAVWVRPLHTPYHPRHQSQVKSDIVRYIINRESYSADVFDYQYSLVNLLSDATIAKEYQVQQSARNKLAFINRYGKHAIRRVKIENVIFLDTLQKQSGKKRQAHHNLAEVNFTVTESSRFSVSHKRIRMTAFISWGYFAPPSEPELKWMNWDGFRVIRYHTQHRNS